MPQLQRLIFAPDQVHATYVTLNTEQKRYLLNVLRLQTGAPFIAMDGQGHWWHAELNCDHDTATLLQPITINNELPISLTLVAAPPKGKGFDEVVHSATELGVRHIYPLLSKRTLARPSDQKINRWQKIAREATEQSLRQCAPVIHSPISLNQVSTTQAPPLGGTRFFCSTQANPLPLTTALQTTQLLHQITIITGPEGGWSPEEEEQLYQMPCIAVSLGRRVLRAVTAPLCALALTAAFLETGAQELEPMNDA